MPLGDAFREALGSSLSRAGNQMVPYLSLMIQQKRQGIADQFERDMALSRLELSKDQMALAHKQYEFDVRQTAYANREDYRRDLHTRINAFLGRELERRRLDASEQPANLEEYITRLLAQGVSVDDPMITQITGLRNKLRQSTGGTRTGAYYASRALNTLGEQASKLNTQTAAWNKTFAGKRFFGEERDPVTGRRLEVPPPEAPFELPEDTLQVLRRYQEEAAAFGEEESYLSSLRRSGAPALQAHIANLEGMTETSVPEGPRYDVPGLLQEWGAESVEQAVADLDAKWKAGEIDEKEWRYWLNVLGYQVSDEWTKSRFPTDYRKSPMERVRGAARAVRGY